MFIDYTKDWIAIDFASSQNHVYFYNLNRQWSKVLLEWNSVNNHNTAHHQRVYELNHLHSKSDLLLLNSLLRATTQLIQRSFCPEKYAIWTRETVIVCILFDADSDT